MRRLPLPFLLVLFVGCQFSASCGGKKLDMAKAREFISSKLEANIGQKPTSVTCPEDNKVAKGGTIECTVAFGLATGKVTMTQDDDQGNVTITSVTGLLIAAALEKQVADSLGKQLNAHIEVACGDRVRTSVKGDKFLCDAKDANGSTAKVEVEVTDDNGKTNFRVMPPPGAPATPPADPGTPPEGAAAAPPAPPAEGTTPPQDPTAPAPAP